MTAGSYPDDGLGEVFLKLGKQGSTLAGVMDAFSIAISIGLQYGVPLEAFVSKFVNMRFEPAGMTDDPDIRMAQSIMDYIFRRLALDYLPYDERAALGIFTAEERAAQLETGSYGGSRARDRRRGRWLESVPVRGAAGQPEARRSTAGLRARRAAAQRRALLGRAAGGDHRHSVRRPAVHDLRDQDAPGRLLLRLRGLREHQRLQLTSSHRSLAPVLIRGPAPTRVCACTGRHLAIDVDCPRAQRHESEQGVALPCGGWTLLGSG